MSIRDGFAVIQVMVIISSHVQFTIEYLWIDDNKDYEKKSYMDNIFHLSVLSSGDGLIHGGALNTGVLLCSGGK